MGYIKSNRGERNSRRLIELIKTRTRLDNASPILQPTLESFGFHIGNKIGGSLACAAPSRQNGQIPICYPFVKWAGGKRQLLWQLYPLAPLKFDRYIEPFLGGGALFFHLLSNKNKRITAYLSDINPELTNSYITVKDNPEKLIKCLEQHEFQYGRSILAIMTLARSFRGSTKDDLKTGQYVQFEQRSIF
jgi:hypothetical protein